MNAIMCNTMGKTRIRVHLFAVVLLCILPTFLYGQSAKSDRHFSKGVELYRSGEYAKAIAEFESAMRLDEAELPEESSRNGYSKQWLANCYYQLGDTAKAREISPMDFLFPPIDRRLTVAIDREDDLALEAMERGEHDEALVHLRRCEELEVAELGADSWFRINTAHSIGHVFSAQEKSQEALDEFARAYDLLCRQYSRDCVLGFELAIDIVGVARALGDWGLSAQYVSIANGIAEGVGLPLLRARAMIVSGNEALFYNNYDDAKSKFCSALSLIADSYDVNDEHIYYLPECVYALESLWAMAEIRDGLKKVMARVEDCPENKSHWGVFLALYGHNANTVEEAVSCVERAISLLEGDERFRSLYYNAICDLASIMDNPYKAIEYLEKVINDEVLEYDAMVYRRALKALADLHDSRGDYRNAVAAYERIVQTYSSASDPFFTLFSMKLATARLRLMLSSAGAQYNDGYKFGIEVKQILQQLGSYDNVTLLTYGVRMNDVINAMLPLFRLLLQISVYDGGSLLPQMEIRLSQMMESYLIPQSGYNNPLTVECLSLLGYIKYLQGNIADAIQILETAIEKRRENGGDPSNHIHDLAYYKYENGDYEGALECFNTGFDFLRRQFTSNFQWMTSSERTLYTNSKIGNVFNLAHYAALNADSPGYCALGYNALLFSKGLLLNSTIELSKLLQEEGDDEALRMLNEWRSVCQARDQQKDKDIDEWYRLDSISQNMERQLLATSKTFGDYTAGLTVDYPDVQKNLRDGDIAIEFFSYRYDANSYMYGALVLKNKGAVQYYPIGLHTQWEQFTDSAYTSPDLFNSLFSSLKGILPHKAQGTIYFSADGLLHTIGIENLRGAEDYDFRRLSSTRELALKRGTAKAEADAAIFGGINYGVGSLADLYEEEEQEAQKGKKRGSESFLPPLFATKAEAANVGKALSGTMSKVDIHTGDNATENAFKAYSGKKIHIMHIATHGFFDEAAAQSLEENSFDESMRYSGLYLTGAQNTLWDEAWDSHGEDGILTSQEISVQDFRGMELAVLSACETGRGAISGDGVFGLQRGFKQAGAQSILMSLWKVDDDATQLLMEQFYSHLKTSSDPYQALKDAQADVRTKYPDPQYWAAFILIDGLTKITMTK